MSGQPAVVKEVKQLSFARVASNSGAKPAPLRVFLSHTSELRRHPDGKSFVAAAERAVLRSNAAVADMDYFTARDLAPAEYCAEEVNGADIYVGVIGFRYGSPVMDRPEMSHTEFEFEIATESRKPRLVFLLDEHARQLLPEEFRSDQQFAGRQDSFRTRLEGARITVSWVATPDSLEMQLHQALTEHRKELEDRRQPAQTPQELELLRWKRIIQNRVTEVWTSGERAPLRAAEVDADRVLHDLHLKADSALLHPVHMTATSLRDGEEFMLDQALTPGELFVLLDQSILIVGEPGAGKSVLLWRIARGLIDADPAETGGAVPVIIELNRWSRFDNAQGEEPPVPRFEDFVAEELAQPSMGIPAKVTTKLLQSDGLVLLLDALDELELDAVRCLSSLASFSSPQVGLRKLAMTSRISDYGKIIDQRDRIGTAAVANAVRIRPIPSSVVEEILAAADPPAGQLRKAIEKRDALRRMVGRPLWLSVAYLVYRDKPKLDPLSSVGQDAGEQEVGRALYERWLPLRLAGETKLKRKHLADLAIAMRGRETLYLEMVQPEWGESLIADLSGRARSKIRRMTLLVSAILLLPILWQLDGAIGLVAGIVFAVIGVSLVSQAFKRDGERLVARRTRRTDDRHSQPMEAAAAGLGIGLTMTVLWAPISGWMIAMILGVAVTGLVGPIWWLQRSRVEDRTSSSGASYPRTALDRSRRTGFAAALRTTLLLAPVLGLVFFAGVRLTAEKLVTVGDLELTGSTVAVLVLLPIVARGLAIVVGEVSDRDSDTGRGGLAHMFGFMARFLLVPTIAGSLFGAVAGLWWGPDAILVGTFVGLTVGLWSYLLFVIAFTAYVGLGGEFRRYSTEFVAAVGFGTLFLCCSPPSAAILGIFLGVAAGLAHGLTGGLGPVLGYRITVGVCARSGLLPRKLLTFLNHACALGVMYPSGPGFRFRHRTLGDMLAEAEGAQVRRGPP